MEHIINTLLSWAFTVLVCASLVKYLVKGTPLIYMWDGIVRKKEDPNWATVDPRHNDTGSRPTNQ